MVAKRKRRVVVCRICKGKHRARGLCEPCYQSAKFKVASGETTWPELESQGLAQPTTKRSTAFSKAFRSTKRRSLS
jgi:hypothetical protein